MKSSKLVQLADKVKMIFHFWLLTKFSLIMHVLITLRNDGFLILFTKIKSYLKRNEYPIDYKIWLKNNELTEEKIRSIYSEISKFSYKPLISIIMPVYNVDQIWLEKAVESVINQLYTNWEFCIVDDASPKSHIKQTLEKFATKDNRIKVKYLTKNQGMCNAYNNALLLATGEFAGTLDHDDELTLDALYEIVKLLNINPDYDMIYSDEDKIDINNKRSDPFFKPDYSPDLLLSMNYICHFTIFRRVKLIAAGGFRVGYEGSLDYDLILRFIEKTNPEQIAHISNILYHWRKIPDSSALVLDAKNYTSVSGKKALCDYLERNKIIGDVSDGNIIGSYRLKRKIEKYDKVSILIPFKDKVRLLEKCIVSILKKTDYPNYEILLINNQSIEQSTIKYLNKINQLSNIRIIEYDKPFNFSAINNYAVEKADGKYIMMLNNDTEVISREWLTSMVEHCQRKEVGAVGAKLLYPNNTIQHAGVVIGQDIASHSFRFLPNHDNGYFGLAGVIRNCSAVTAACLLIRKDVFNELGGLNEKELKIAYNDVDLCLKIIDKGYYIIYTPYSVLYHHESVSRGIDNFVEFKLNNTEKYNRVIAEREYISKKWQKYIEHDPYNNFNL